MANDSDVEGPLDPCDVTIVNQPANGTALIGAAPTCSLTYTPDSGYSGLDSFIYQVCHSGGACATGAVNITVSDVNDAPTVVADSPTIDEDTPSAIDVLANDSDSEGP